MGLNSGVCLKNYSIKNFQDWMPVSVKLNKTPNCLCWKALYKNKGFIRSDVRLILNILTITSNFINIYIYIYFVIILL